MLSRRSTRDVERAGDRTCLSDKRGTQGPVTALRCNPLPGPKPVQLRSGGSLAAPVSSIFERELKGLLSGDMDVIRKVTGALEGDVADSYSRIAKRPFMVVRAAGSLGVDLVALRSDVCFPIEVKASSSMTIHLSNTAQMKEQAQKMLSDCAVAGIIPIYAYRKKNLRGRDPWRLYSLPSGGFSGAMRLLYERIPKAAVSDGGNFILRFDEGMPLARFMDYVTG